MHCRTVRVGGSTMIVCGERPKPKPCACGQPSRFLCDWKLGDGKTCDAPLCADSNIGPGCANQVGRDKHLCPEHRVAWRKHPSNPANRRKADAAPSE